MLDTLRRWTSMGMACPTGSAAASLSPYDKFHVQLNNGAGFDPMQDWGPVDSQNVSSYWRSISRHDNGQSVSMLDMNGDGLLDRVMRHNSSPYTKFKVQLNTGSGFGPMIDWLGIDSLGSDTSQSKGSIWEHSSGARYIETVDINGDGLPDRVRRGLDSPYDKFHVQLNNGAGFDPMEDWGPVDSQKCQFRLAVNSTRRQRPERCSDGYQRRWACGPCHASQQQPVHKI